MKTNYEKILSEVSRAYADCPCKPDVNAMDIRNLEFRASARVTRDEAISIFNEAGVTSYNNFTPSLLKKLPEGAGVTIAREGSVCIYVDKRIASGSAALKADEMTYCDRETRIWWD